MNKQMRKLVNLIGFRAFLLTILLVTALVQLLLMLDNVRGVTYDVQLTQLAPETIRSSKTVEDTVKTEREREEAAAMIEPVYVLHEEVPENRAKLVSNMFDILVETRSQIEKLDPKPKVAEQVELVRKNSQELADTQTGLGLSSAQIEAALKASDTELINARDVLSNEVRTFLREPLRKENIATARNEFETKLRQLRSSDDPLLSTLVTLGRAAVIETETLDEEKTALYRQQARDAIEPTRILQGQVLVQEGEYVDREIYRQLELLGMVENKSSIKPILGLIIFTTLQMSFMYILFARTKMELEKKRNAVLVTAIVYTFTIMLMKLLSLVTEHFDVMAAFVFPTALATLLVRFLANYKAASLVTVMTAASGGIIFHKGYTAVLQMDVALYIIFGGFAALFFLRTVEKRAHLLQACGVIALVNVLFIAFYLLMSQSNYGMKEIVFYLVAGIASGILSGALTMGLLPFFESAFGLLSTLRLIELSNPNHPLLKKVLTETPGTYHHSLMVANLAERACEAIGADGLLARVGCYYHDVGKTVRPHYFIENQMSGVNPHDTLPPQKSAEIILAHTTDGASLLHEYKMPQEIIDIALQHHGTSALKYFIFKAKEQGIEVEEQQYRYPGPKPQTKEAAVISIADSVEAAVRSMKEPTAEKIQACIRAIIQDRVQDHQFDECDVSIKELKTIENALLETLNGIFHSRIEYPKEA